MGDISDLMRELAYVKGSLTNLDLNGDGKYDSFLFKLKNPPVPLAGKVTALKLIVDGEPIENDSILIFSEGLVKADELRGEKGLAFKPGSSSLWLVLKEGGLSRGLHKVSIRTLLEGFDDIWVSFSFEDEVNEGVPIEYSSTPNEGLGIDYPVVLSSNFAYSVLSRAGDLSVDWEWMGVRYDVGGLYVPPMKSIGPLRVGLLIKGEEFPLKDHVMRYKLGPGYLEVTCEVGDLKLSRRSYMIPQEGCLVEEFTANKEVSLVIKGEGGPIPYGLLGYKAPDVEWREYANGLLFISQKLGHYGFLMSDAKMMNVEVRGIEEPHGFNKFRVVLEPKKIIKVIIGGGGDVKRASHQLRYLKGTSYRLALMHYMELLSRSTTLMFDDEELSKAFNLARLSLYYLYMDHPEIGKGIAAGLPRFPTYWGRDTAWSLRALISISDWVTSRSVLENMLSRVKGREVPMVVGGKGFLHTTSYGSADSSLYYPSLLYEYVKASGDSGFLRKWYSVVKALVERGFELDEDGDSLLEHPLATSSPLFTLPDTTWMDHVDRRKSAVEVQSLWCYALQCAARLASMTGDSELSRRYLKEAERVKELINSIYWNGREGCFYDTIKPDGEGDPSIRPNALVPLIYALVDEQKAHKVLRRIEGSDMTTPWGVRTLSSKDPRYKPDSYHNGGVWPLVTGWAALAEFRYGRGEEGYRYVKLMAKRIILEGGMYAEVYRGDKPVPFNSCILQAWSIALFLASVMSMIGVERDALSSRLQIRPVMPPLLRVVKVDNLKVGGSRLSLLINNVRGVVEVVHKEGGPILISTKEEESISKVGQEIRLSL